MRKHGWQLPYHPLQVVAISVFLALGVAFYVFFMPFVGKKLFQRLAMGIYTPLVTCVFSLYIWCAATDPGDPGVFKSKKYLDTVEDFSNNKNRNECQEVEGSISPKTANEVLVGINETENDVKMVHVEETSPKEPETYHACCWNLPFCIILFLWYPLSFLRKWICSDEQSSEQQSSEDGMFYCSLCEVEVFKYSKHCRVCDKCVHGFDHHCRWLNNCIGKKNYWCFFILMVSALILLILQWLVGIFVLVRCFLERNQFGVDIASKLGSSFSLVPFIVVVVSCTFLAMVATLPLAQLLFFHILLIEKGISTYDYIIALREQEQQDATGQQSPQMSPLSSLTGLSSASSLNTFRRGAWCTPPRLLLEDQFDVITPDTGSSKRIVADDLNKKKNTATVRINPWTLARLNAKEVSRAAAQARQKSKILQPVVKEKAPGQETDSSFDNLSGKMATRNDHRRRGSRSTTRLPVDIRLEPHATASKSTSSDLVPATSRNLAPLQLEARNAFHKSKAMSSAGVVASSPDSSLDSPDVHLFRASSSGPDEPQELTAVSSTLAAGTQKGIQLSRSTSDGYEASGGEDSDKVPARIVHRSLNWSNLLFNSGPGDVENALRPTSSSSTRLHSNSSRMFQL